MNGSIEIFLCYAREDEALLKELEKHLRVLRRQGIIDLWYDRNISAGADWEREIDNHLNTARVILLLVSPDFLDSDYCYGIEMKRAMERHEQGEACVIPIILRHVYWHKTPFGKLQALPIDSKPILSSHWVFKDEAWYNTAEGIRIKVEDIIATDKAKQCTDKGNKLYEQKQYAKAIVAYDEALKYDPKYFRAYYNKGSTYGLLMQFEEAIAAFDEVIRIEPKEFRAYKSIGYALFCLERYKEALKAYQQAFAIDPNDNEVNENILQLHNLLNSRDELSKVQNVY